MRNTPPPHTHTHKYHGPTGTHTSKENWLPVRFLNIAPNGEGAGGEERGGESRLPAGHFSLPPTPSPSISPCRGSEGEIPKPGPVSIAIRKRALAHTSTGGPDLALLVVVCEGPGSQGHSKTEAAGTRGWLRPQGLTPAWSRVKKGRRGDPRGRSLGARVSWGLRARE